jgi:hypothetical protein
MHKLVAFYEAALSGQTLPILEQADTENIQHCIFTLEQYNKEGQNLGIEKQISLPKVDTAEVTQTILMTKSRSERTHRETQQFADLT